MPESLIKQQSLLKDKRMTEASTTKMKSSGDNNNADDTSNYRYNAALASVIEKRWQTYWEDNDTNKVPNPGDPGFDASKPKFYCLDMFPYPSGAGLHVGHPLGYIATDIISRYKRMCGFNVLHPMGFDAFGLPAEQYAVEHGIHPKITTDKNIATMVRQLKALGLGYDWSREVATIEEDYYKWTQWIFLKLYNSYFDVEQNKARPIEELVAKLESGDKQEFADLTEIEKEQVLANHRLAYLAEVPVNWCPELGTVLANEEVTNEGRSERGNYPVFKRPLKQWMLRITAYADRLEDDLQIVNWPESTKQMQRNWIGRSNGAQITFSIEDSPSEIKVFTTRPDTIFGATYMVLAPEHELVDQITTKDQSEAVREYQHKAAAQSDIDRMVEDKTKTGVFTGAFAINPATKKQIPIWIADYVLMGYGTGAIMAVPAQDQRDWDFAKTFNLPILRTVQPPDDFDGEAFVGDGLTINSDFLNGLGVGEAKKKIIEWLNETGFGFGTLQYKLRDWLFSRQRYWGEPFPIMHAPDGRIVAVDEADLPVVLPQMQDFMPSASDDPDAPPKPPLARSPETWREVDHNGTKLQRELNTMPQWAGSCWYYLRFTDPENSQQFTSKEAEQYWMGDNGIDLYVGGVEHAVLHLLYARFWHKVLYDLGHVSTPEPFGRLFNQGYIQAFAYRDERGIAVEALEVVDQDGSPATEVQDQKDRKYFCNGEPVTQEYGKMGKSLKNAVSPDDMCEQYGCDTLRLYEMYLGPLEASKAWNTRDIVGPFRYLQRAWRLAIDESTGELNLLDTPNENVEKQLHRTIAKVAKDVKRLAFNTAIASMIEFVNVATSAGGLTRDQLERFILIIAPFTPHIAEELWSKLGHENSLVSETWPEHDEAMLADDLIELPVQIKGKVRAKLMVPPDMDAKKLEELVLADEKVIAALAGKTVRKVIVIQGKIVNIVAN